MMNTLDIAGNQSQVSSCMSFLASGAARDAYHRLLKESTAGQSKGEQRKAVFVRHTKEDRKRIAKAAAKRVNEGESWQHVAAGYPLSADSIRRNAVAFGYYKPRQKASEMEAQRKVYDQQAQEVLKLAVDGVTQVQAMAKVGISENAFYQALERAKR
jgi:hypothetical protein